MAPGARPSGVQRRGAGAERAAAHEQVGSDRPAPSLADAHAHLAMEAFAEDLPAVIQRARGAGVSEILACATSLRDAAATLEAARAHGLRAAVGFHPHQAREWNEGAESALRRLIETHAAVAAVGEVGLDFHYDRSPRPVQTDVLRRQVALARDARLPLVIHCRRAREQLGSLLVEERAFEAGGMLHCFSEDARFARFCLDLGFFISFSGIVTFKNAEEIREAVRIVPMDRLLVETDAPYLAPVPHRGRRNEPALVVEVARAVAALKAVPYEELAGSVVENYRRLFARAAPD